MAKNVFPDPGVTAQDLMDSFSRSYETTVEPMVIGLLVNKIHSDNVEKGFWPSEKYGTYGLATAVALIQSEASELLEELRRSTPRMSEKLPHVSAEEEELADLIIRALDYAGARGFANSIGLTIRKKLAHNESRPPRHGKSF